MIGRTAEFLVGGYEIVKVQTIYYATDQAHRIIYVNILAHIRRKQGRLSLIVKFKL